MKRSSGIRNIYDTRSKLIVRRLHEYKVKFIADHVSTYQQLFYSDSRDTIIQNLLIILFQKIAQHLRRLEKNSALYVSTVHSMILVRRINRIVQGLKKIFSQLRFIDRYLKVYIRLRNKILMHIQIPNSEYEALKYRMDKSPP